MGRRGPAAERGAMLLLLLFLVAALGVLLAVAGRVWHTEMRRDKEAQLLFAGEEYRRALARYRDAAPPGQPKYPETLGQLLLDERGPVPVRHLRRLYRDPCTGRFEWGLVKEGGRIAGVYSLGEERPLKESGFAGLQAKFGGARSYADWRFLAGEIPPPAGPAGPSAAPPPTGSNSSASPAAPLNWSPPPGR